MRAASVVNVPLMRPGLKQAAAVPAEADAEVRSQWRLPA